MNIEDASKTTDKNESITVIRHLNKAKHRMIEKMSATTNKSFLTIFIVYLMINLGLDFGETLISPLAKSLGAAPVLIGFVATGFTYGSIIFRLVSGAAIDYFNRKKMLLMAVGVIIISLVGEAFAPSVSVLIVFRIIQGVGQAFTAPICLTMAAGIVSSKKMAGGIGALSVARGFATLFSPIVSLKISEVTSYKTAFILAAIIECISIVAIFKIPSKKSKEKKSRHLKISLKGLLVKEAIPPALLQFLFMMAWSSVFAFLVVFGQEKGLGSNVGYFNTVYGLSIFISAPLGGKLVDEYGYYMLLPMMVLMSLSLWTISISSNIFVLLIAAVLGAFGYGAAGPVARSISMKVVPANRRGAASSTLYIASDIGQLLGPVIGGFIVSKLGYSTMFRVAPVWILLAAILLLVTKTKIKKNSSANENE